MKQEDKELLENDGWTIVCEYPFEIKYLIRSPIT